MLKIVVPYRDREISLRLYLLYNIPFFNRYYAGQYEIAIVEQTDDSLFSVSRAINLGYRILKPRDNDTFVFSPADIYIKQPCLECDNNDKMKLFSENAESDHSNFEYHGYDFFSMLGGFFGVVNGLDNRCEGWGGEDRLFLKNIRFFDKEFSSVKKIYIGDNDVAYQDPTTYPTKHSKRKDQSTSEWSRTEKIIETFSAPNRHGLRELVATVTDVFEYSPSIKHYMATYSLTGNRFDSIKIIS